MRLKSKLLRNENGPEVPEWALRDKTDNKPSTAVQPASCALPVYRPEGRVKMYLSKWLPSSKSSWLMLREQLEVEP